MIKSNKKTLASLKKGDKIWIEYGGSVMKVKVLSNYPKKQEIYLKVFFWCWGMEKEIRSYSDYNFEHFDLLNNG